MDPSFDTGQVGDIPLLLADATKSVETAPNKISIGIIRLRGWQLHQLFPMPPDFERHAGYLVRANYEFDVAADVPPPAWAEVEFTFVEDVTVVDALPRAVTISQHARAFYLNTQLNFLPHNGHDTSLWSAGSAAADVALPAVTPRIDCFGVGSDMVRWRHSANGAETVSVGSHTGWFVLLTPPGLEKVNVRASGGYQIELDRELDLVPTCRPDAFTIMLPAKLPSPPVAKTADNASGPRVFVSYSQESAEHKGAVKLLCAILANHGVDVRFDQQGLYERRNWMDWTNSQILRSDFVIVIASPAYLAASENRLPLGLGLGVRSEYLRLADLLHRDNPQWTKKILPVVLPGRSVQEIPLTFLPGIADHYVIEQLTPQGIADLLKALRRESDG